LQRTEENPILWGEETAMPKIEVYTQPWCPYCAQAMRLLQSKGTKPCEINAPHGSPERETAIHRSGGRTTMPQIFIGGTHVGGCDDLMALEAAGKLDPLLRAA
jgi:glutaredoxin 3